MAIEGSKEDALEEILMEFPIIRSIEGTAYSGRIDRIESIKKGDKLILRADYNSEYYSPVAVEVFNTDGETLGFLKEDSYLSLKSIALAIDHIDARVADVTPLSKRRKNAKYALMDVELSLKDRVIDAAPTVISGDKVRTQDISENDSKKNDEIKQLNSDSIDMANQHTKDSINSSLETSMGDVERSESEPEPSVPTLAFTFEDGLTFKGLGYSIAIPDGFRFQQNMEVTDSIGTSIRAFIAWSPNGLNPEQWDKADVAILSAVKDPWVDIFTNPVEYFENVKEPLVGLGKQVDCEVSFKSFCNGSVCGGYVVQQISENCVNYHCIVGENGNTHRFRVIINKPYLPQSMNSAVEAWLRSMECKITDEDKAKLEQLGAEAKKLKADDALAQTGAFVDEVRNLLKKFSETWQSTITGLQNQMAAKVYMSQDEVNRDMKAIIGSRDKFGKNYDELIYQIDENGEKLLTLGADYRSVEKIIDLIDETVKESRELDLDFGTTGATVMNIGSARFQISESSEKIRRKWQQRRPKEDRSSDIKMSAPKSVSNEEEGLAEGYEKAKASIRQEKAGKERAEANIQKIQAEISELEADLERQNKKLFFKNKTYINQLNATVSEKRARLKEYQEAREQCSQHLQELEEELKSKYARLIQEEEERKRRGFVAKYRNYAMMGSQKQTIAKALLSAMNKTEWVTIAALHNVTYFREQDISTVLRLLIADGLVERTVDKKRSFYKLSDEDIKDILNRG